MKPSLDAPSRPARSAFRPARRARRGETAQGWHNHKPQLTRHNAKSEVSHDNKYCNTSTAGGPVRRAGPARGAAVWGWCAAAPEGVWVARAHAARRREASRCGTVLLDYATFRRFCARGRPRMECLAISRRSCPPHSTSTTPTSTRSSLLRRHRASLRPSVAPGGGSRVGDVHPFLMCRAATAPLRTCARYKQ